MSKKKKKKLYKLETFGQILYIMYHIYGSITYLWRHLQRFEVVDVTSTSGQHWEVFGVVLDVEVEVEVG